MALTVEVIKAKMKAEGKLTAEEIYWILDHIDSLEKKMHAIEEKLDDRLRKLEREKDDHIPGGI